jgi:erythromycin esterase-like protein
MRRAHRTVSSSLRDLVRSAATPLDGHPDFDALFARIGNARLVLLGEASHGTHEFYRVRAEITKRLITERGFDALAVEADWPDAYRVNRFVRGASIDESAAHALGGFERFPQWMWRNADVLELVRWLRAYNDARRSGERKAGFYGLDLYSLHASMDAVIRYLRVVDPVAAERAARRYGCFERFGGDPQEYGHASTLGLSASCESEVLAQLLDLRRSAGDYASHDGRVAEDDLFFAEQNARLVANAEQYYRAMFQGRVLSWNLRDQHMVETLEALVTHLGHDGHEPRIVIWAHNSHLGDARATELGDEGELNVGQLVREHYGAEAVLVGFSTYTGTVTAASDWDAPAERMRVRPGLPESYEALFHELDLPAFYLEPGSRDELAEALSEARLQRAIGVIYRPRTERQSHYFMARLSDQFDAILHYDVTRAVEPLERRGRWSDDAPETYPTAL